MNRRLRLAFVVVALSACHAQPSGSHSGSVRNVITTEEIDASRATNVYDLIAQLRADFLKDRGKISIKSNTREQAVVFLNDQEYGTLETLRNIPPGRLSEIRYLTGIEAVNRFGSQYGGGVVLLISRNQ